MTDYFDLLNESRRPWLDTDSLKRKFLELSANLHPDKIHSASDTEKSTAAKRFAELNTAYSCLSEPKLRLLHLLELECGSKPKDIQQIPSNLADLFAEVATVCRSADSFLVEKSKVSSPLLQVQYFQKAQDWIEMLNTPQQKLNAFQEQLSSTLKTLDARWLNRNDESRIKILQQLEELYRLFGYFNRWNSQIQERIVQLTF